MKRIMLSVCVAVAAAGVTVGAFAEKPGPAGSWLDERSALQSRSDAKSGVCAQWGCAPDGTFWNGFSKWAMKPPTLAFDPVEGAAKYRFVVIDDRHERRTLEYASPQASLAPVWDKVPSNGFVTVEGSGWCWRNCHIASAFALLRLCQTTGIRRD